MAGRKKTTKGFHIPTSKHSVGPGVKTKKGSAKEFMRWMNGKMR